MNLKRISEGQRERIHIEMLKYSIEPNLNSNSLPFVDSEQMEQKYYPVTRPLPQIYSRILCMVENTERVQLVH